ncbi:unnamed protein product [Gongylonema pulchrum]|uniref:DUF4371 domain-containing protein n=1 Tax=Gongylonema pulchrum TaxID=637853 RepID=A0A183D2N0_9BILA|nr:unnamed protein product [Gongylonema pulchrum]
MRPALLLSKYPKKIDYKENIIRQRQREDNSLLSWTVRILFYRDKGTNERMDELQDSTNANLDFCSQLKEGLKQTPRQHFHCCCCFVNALAGIGALENGMKPEMK